jgi:hypothetical protein
MKKTLLLSLIFFTCVFNGYSQEGLSSEKVEEYTQLSFNLEGTYQIQMIDTRSTPAITLDLFPQIEERRDTKEIVYLNISPKMRIKILPDTIINAPNFIGIERIAYINSTDI